MRVALFGGSFNPPHVAHQLAALYVLETRPVDELWMLPCFLHPFEKSLLPFADRLAMCQRALAPLGPRARVEAIEGELGGESRTLRTVQALTQRHPDHRFSLVIGSDLEAETDGWFGAGELRQLIDFLVVGRAGHPLRAGSEATVLLPDVSSTEVRARLAAGRSVDDLVPRSVLDYIREKGLYGPGAAAAPST